MKNTVKWVVFVLCAALCVALLTSGKKDKTPAGTGFPATGEWGVSADEDNGGSSTVTISSAEENIDGQTVTTYTVKGNVTTQYQYGYAVWKIEPDDVTLERIKKATGISFTIQGDGQRYAIKFKTKECESDYCYYEYGFNTEAGVPITVEVPVKMFMQPSWGQWKKFNQESFTGLEWQTHENWRKSPTTNPFEIKIWDVKIWNN
jgi:hypothetical protein